jgi:hypothetical protein
MEKDGSKEDQASYQKIQGILVDSLPYLFSPKYDDPVERRIFRDAYLSDVIMGLLVSTEKKRTTTDNIYWTIEELYVACIDIWVGVMSSVLIGREGMLYPNPHYLRDRLLCYIIQYFGYDSKFHFINGHGHTHPTEDNIIPFNILDLCRVIDSLTLEGKIGVVHTTKMGRKCIDVEYLKKELDTLKERWIALNPKKKAQTDKDLFDLIFKRSNHDMLERILYTCRTASKETGSPWSVITMAELLVHGDGVHNYFLHIPVTSEPLTTSKYTLPEHKEGRTIIEPYPYGYPRAPEEDRKQTILGTYVNGSKYMADQIRPVLDAFPDLVTTTSNEPIRGVAALVLDTPTVCHFPSGLDTFSLQESTDSTMNIIEAFLHINPTYEAHIEEELAKIDKERAEKKD